MKYLFACGGAVVVLGICFFAQPAHAAELAQSDRILVKQSLDVLQIFLNEIDARITAGTIQNRAEVSASLGAIRETLLVIKRYVGNAPSPSANAPVSIPQGNPGLSLELTPLPNVTNLSPAPLALPPIQESAAQTASIESAFTSKQLIAAVVLVILVALGLATGEEKKSSARPAITTYTTT